MSAQIRYNPAMATTRYPECEGPFVVWSKDSSGHLQPRSVESFDRAVDLYLSDTLKFVAIMEVVPINISDGRIAQHQTIPGDGRTVTVALDDNERIIHAALNTLKRREEIQQKVLTWITSDLTVKQIRLSEIPEYYSRDRIEFIRE